MKDVERIGHICGTEGKQRYLSLVPKGSMAQDKMAVKAQITLGPNKYVKDFGFQPKGNRAPMKILSRRMVSSNLRFLKHLFVECIGGKNSRCEEFHIQSTLCTFRTMDKLSTHSWGPLAHAKTYLKFCPVKNIRKHIWSTSNGP